METCALSTRVLLEYVKIPLQFVMMVSSAHWTRVTTTPDCANTYHVTITVMTETRAKSGNVVQLAVRSPHEYAHLTQPATTVPSQSAWISKAVVLTQNSVP